MRRLFKSEKTLFLACYLAFFLISAAACLYGFCEDRILRATGKLEEFTLSAADFELVDLAPAEGQDTYISTSTDPRMLLTRLPGQVRTVEMKIDFSGEPGEMTLFYMPKAGMEEFSPSYRVWAVKTGEGRYSFTLPRKDIYGLRIDPGMYNQNRMTFLSIRCNTKRPASAYFTLSSTWLFYFTVCPALIASALKYLIALYQHFAGPRRHELMGQHAD